MTLINWFDIPVEDIERAGKFYGTILDVELNHLETPDFVMKWFPAPSLAESEGGLIQGGGRKPSRDGTVVYFNGGTDLDTILSRVEAAGGRIEMPKTGDDSSGYVAFFIDTEGNKIGLHSTG